MDVHRFFNLFRERLLRSSNRCQLANWTTSLGIYFFPEIHDKIFTGKLLQWFAILPDEILKIKKDPYFSI